MNASGRPYRLLRRIGILPARCFFPLAALIIIVGSVIWGVWISLALALGTWRIVGRFA